MGNSLDTIWDVFQDEFKISIIMTLMTFGAQNLQNLTHILDSAKTTTLTHIKDLVNQEIIEIDARSSASKWGKYYQVTEKVKQIILNGPGMKIDGNEDKLAEKLKQAAISIRAVSTLTHNIIKRSANYIHKSADNPEKVDLLSSEMIIALAHVNFKKKKDLMNILKEIEQFQKMKGVSDPIRGEPIKEGYLAFAAIIPVQLLDLEENEEDNEE